ncbi:MAG: hypothetical protein Tsb009_31490 [Planctomycetaceae bacterium]
MIAGLWLMTGVISPAWGQQRVISKPVSTVIVQPANQAGWRSRNNAPKPVETTESSEFFPGETPALPPDEVVVSQTQKTPATEQIASTPQPIHYEHPGIQPIVPQQEGYVIYGGDCNGNCPSGAFAYRECPPCPPFGEHRTGVFGEFLYLTARGANIAYATPVDGLGANARPIGSMGVADPDYEPGFRAGAWIRLNTNSSIGFSYSLFQSDTSDGISLPGGSGFVRAELTHPNVTNVAADSLFARTTYDIDFDLIDFLYRRTIKRKENYALNYTVGIRYAHINQDLESRYFITGLTAVRSEIDFDGVATRLGLDGERLLGNGIFVYTNGFLNLFLGEFKAKYLQSNVFAGTQAATGYEDDRIVTQLEFESGIGWRSRCGRVRISAGYYIAAWFNSITTPTWMEAIQQNDFSDMSETLTFDGYTIRVEFRW